MAPRKNPPPTIEKRILSAIRIAGQPRTISQLHGPGQPGLTSRRASEIKAACELMADRGELVRGEIVPSWSDTPRKTYALPEKSGNDQGGRRPASIGTAGKESSHVEGESRAD